MRKNLLLVPVLLLSVQTSWAADQYKFNGDPGCALKKFQDKKWQTATADEVTSGTYEIQPAKYGLSTFKANGLWYSAKTDCFMKSDGSAGDTSTASAGSSSDSAGGGFMHKIYAELRLTDYIMAGTGASGTTTTGVSGTAPSGATTLTTTTKYSPGIGFSGRGGYNLNDRSSVFLDLGYFSGKQTGTMKIGALSAVSSTQADKIININVGYQRLFSDKGIIPFATGSLGMSKLSSTFDFASTTPLEVTTSASAINITLEGGAMYALSKSFSVFASLDYILMSVSSETVSTATPSNAPGATAYPAGGTYTNTLGYNRIGINLGARYQF